MARREEEFKGLQQEREAKQAARAAARKAEREMARRREFMRRCNLTVEARVAELEAEAAVVAEARRVEEEAERSRKVCACVDGGCLAGGWGGRKNDVCGADALGNGKCNVTDV